MKEYTINVEADTYEEAKAKVMAQVPEGQRVVVEWIKSRGVPQSVQASEETTAAAFEKAASEIPADAVILDKKETIPPSSKILQVEAFDEESARTEIKSQIGTSAGTISSIKMAAAGAKGIFGAGKKPNQYEVKVQYPCTVEITYQRKAIIEATIGYPNYGVLDNTFNSAAAYWTARRMTQNTDPFVISVFKSDNDAREALLEISCIHLNRHNNLTCSEVLIYGYYPLTSSGEETGLFEAFIAGDDLTYELWEEAKASFAKHGGQLKNEQQPTRHFDPLLKGKPEPQNVVFIKETYETTNGERIKYRIHQGPNIASALAFLEENHNSRDCTVVETPDGTYCRDVRGFHKM